MTTTINRSSIASIPAATLLAVTSPADLFLNDEEKTKRLYRQLTMRWHPDRAVEPDAVEVFQHIKTLYEKALDQIKAGIWGNQKVVKFETKDSFIEAIYLREDTPGHCNQYTAKKNVYLKFPLGNEDLVKQWRLNWDTLLSKLPAKPGIDKVFQATLLASPTTYNLVDGTLVRLEKFEGYFCLKHVLEKFPNGLDPRHVAWILSRLYNLSCLMQSVGVPNLGISTQAAYINPNSHDVVLLDGWQYASEFYDKALAAPAKATRLCPDLAATGIVKHSHVLTLIKAVGREALGDSIGVNLQKRADVPPALTKWLNSPSGDDCPKEYVKWTKARDEAFGPPKFIELKLKESDVY